MTPRESEDLAVRLSQTWPKGLPAPAWDDAIRHLDAGVAGTAFVRLRAGVSTTTGPTVADFLAAYSALDTKRPDQYADCDHCGGTGWQPVTTPSPHGVEYDTGVTPCRCPRGRNREDTHRRIIDHNANELANALGTDPRRNAT